MKCALVHLKRRGNLYLSFAALFVCFFLISGLSLAAIVFGLIVSYIGDILFLLLSKEKSDNEHEVIDENTDDHPQIDEAIDEDFE